MWLINVFQIGNMTGDVTKLQAFDNVLISMGIFKFYFSVVKKTVI